MCPKAYHFLTKTTKSVPVNSISQVSAGRDVNIKYREKTIKYDYIIPSGLISVQQQWLSKCKKKK